ncbi:hypothetical protein CTAYLR_008186 [Chrysophaeum taylorii]|uniref:DUF1279 domain-containing protein n=1 Tax=Chrysophaeum taylorii TaxID=2483200 RepID=A0AAD7UBG4_9STRA|nr:hypothetical protein CTAYLR_008186 [Chrysophaeum taylorii]
MALRCACFVLRHSALLRTRPRWTSTAPDNETWSNRLRRLATTYGPLALGFHIGVEVLVFGGFYYGVTHDLDVPVLLAKVENLTGWAVPISPQASNLLVAYLLTTSLTGFPRTVLTVVATPWIAKRLGWKPMVPPRRPRA